MFEDLLPGPDLTANEADPKSVKGPVAPLVQIAGPRPPYLASEAALVGQFSESCAVGEAGDDLHTWNTIHDNFLLKLISEEKPDTGEEWERVVFLFNSGFASLPTWR